jgi:mono/diheme cytochrome c family protein
MNVSRARAAHAMYINVACRALERHTAGQEATSADDPRKGHQLATMVCAFCHVAAPDQANMPILNPAAPSFESRYRFVLTRRSD